MRIVYDVVRDGLAALDSTNSQMATARQQVTTGRRINQLSDDPSGAALAVGEHAAISGIDAYTQTASDASSRLAAADTVLNSYIDGLSSAIATATGAVGSTATPATRAAAAQQILSLRDALVGDVNSQFGGTYLFSGAKTDTQSYAQVGGVWTYQGDHTPVQVAVQDSSKVSITIDGQALVQGSAATDVFTTLTNIAQSIQSGNDTATTAGMQDLEAAFDRATTVQSRIGLDENSTDTATQQLSQLRLAADTRRSKLEDANLADAIEQMNQADTAYKAALGAVSTAERISLLDYLQ